MVAELGRPRWARGRGLSAPSGRFLTNLPSLHSNSSTNPRVFLVYLTKLLQSWAGSRGREHEALLLLSETSLPIFNSNFSTNTGIPRSFYEIVAELGRHAASRGRKGKMRPKCSSCDRPLRVCLCSKLPPRPIPTTTRLLILQHPHETRHKLATVPIVSRCLSDCEVIVGRRLTAGSSSLLDAFASSSSSLLASQNNGSHAENGKDWQCGSCGQRKSVLLLFPTPLSTDLGSWVRRAEDGKCAGGHVVLLLVDGTWQHATEMVKASMPFLGGFVEQVCLPHDVAREGWGMGDCGLIIRKEPFGGCVSTMEAVARALAILETGGVQIEEILLSVLRQMVGLQAANFAPLKPRLRLQKRRPLKHPPAQSE